MRESKLEQLVAPGTMRKLAGGFEFVEGPVWHGDDAALIFSDIFGDCMYRYDPASGEVATYRQPSNKANGNVFDLQHRLVTCEHSTSRVVRQEHDGSLTVMASHHNGLELNSPNDIVVDRLGCLYFTDPPYGRLPRVGIERPQLQPVQGVYRLDPRDSSIVLLADDFDRPNGLCLAEDEQLLYVNDSARMHVRCLEIRGDEVTGDRIWAQLTGAGPGVADGMKIDSEGNLYCCGPGGVHVFSDAGRFYGVIRVPEEVANFTWGGEGRKVLYLTASTALYGCQMRVPGRPAW